MSDAAVSKGVVTFAAKQMRKTERDILRCVDQLSEEQVWARGGEWENSVGNLLLHLEGNMRQWILHGIGGKPDVRERDAEFALAVTVSAAEARAKFSTTVEESCKVIEAVAPERLLEVIDPQPGGTWRHPTVLEAILLVEGHVRQHMGQIVVLAKQMLAKDLDLSMPRKR
ncbi:DUF1572 domain-containing protein [Granulicella sp. 5B5]|uniref:DinB family protein n=1 Tax=Granulicella sp. 5B5 TaxID=1617967 RepID=UPI0015F4856B|nr:DUF1572 family protein [Granulicella sp. 5B5]QMV19342.1 DUF1572 domain-containing protein [Granulicella sp. 5B5]